MPEPHPIQHDLTSALAHEALDGCCADGGVVLIAGARSWGAHETGAIHLPRDNKAQVIAVAYDEREAPYAVDAYGCEDQGTLLSLSDEGERLTCVWAHPTPPSQLLGVGIDLAARDDFGGRPGTERFTRLLFTEHEQNLAHTLYPDDLPLAFATLFAAKEAAFKACAAPLRRWYESHDEELSFDLRHFCMVEPHLMRGDARNGAAQRAMEAMGIAEMRVAWRAVEGAALVVATARAS